MLLAPAYTVTEKNLTGKNLTEIVHVLKQAYDSQERYIDRLE